MNRIEFIGNSLFIPFFLISVGMLVDVRVIMNGPTALIVAGTLTVVAISGKWLASLITQLWFKYSVAQRQLIFGLSGAHAAATLAVITIGHREGIIDDNILNGTVILILIDRKSTRLNSSHVRISYAVFCLKKKTDGPSGVRIMKLPLT